MNDMTEDDDYDALSQKQLASLKRDMRVSLEDAAVRATHKVMAEFDREALAKPEQEPVETYIHEYRSQPHPNDFGISKGHWWQAKQYADALYTTPPHRKPLSDDELSDIWFKQSTDWMEFARAIEAAHGIKEKNT